MGQNLKKHITRMKKMSFLFQAFLFSHLGIELGHFMPCFHKFNYEMQNADPNFLKKNMIPVEFMTHYFFIKKKKKKKSAIKKKNSP